MLLGLSEFFRWWRPPLLYQEEQSKYSKAYKHREKKVKDSLKNKSKIIIQNI